MEEVREIRSPYAYTGNTWKTLFRQVANQSTSLIIEAESPVHPVKDPDSPKYPMSRLVHRCSVRRGLQQYHMSPWDHGNEGFGCRLKKNRIGSSQIANSARKLVLSEETCGDPDPEELTEYQIFCNKKSAPRILPSHPNFWNILCI